MKTRISLCVAALFLSCAATAGPGGCTEQGSTDAQQSASQETMLAQANDAIGMPAIVNFQERRMMKEILEKRDRSIATVTYLTDLNGHLHKLCDSVGYGLPYATQFTNPSRPVGDSYHALATLPQADPNGLFSPAAADGTWVACLDPATKHTEVVYIEPHVIVSPFPLSTD